MHAHSSVFFRSWLSGNENPVLVANVATYWTPERRVVRSQAAHARHAGRAGCCRTQDSYANAPLHSLARKQASIPCQLKEPATQVETRGGALASLIRPSTLGASQSPPKAESDRVSSAFPAQLDAPKHGIGVAAW